ncbi:hypothetical protein ACFX2H_012382 [Malus domestica]
MKSETNDSIGLQTARFAALWNRLCYYGSLTTAGVTLGAHENIVKVAKIVESKGKQPTTLGEVKFPNCPIDVHVHGKKGFARVACWGDFSAAPLHFAAPFPSSSTPNRH